jgi:pimeloyl-ACP methyl ester carboxylesterase
MATRGRTIVYDRRGHFRSERPAPYVTNVHEQSDDAAALIDALAAAPAIVIGRSYGGAIALDLALRYRIVSARWCSWKETVGCRRARRHCGSWRSSRSPSSPRPMPT